MGAGFLDLEILLNLSMKCRNPYTHTSSCYPTNAIGQKFDSLSHIEN